MDNSSKLKVILVWIVFIAITAIFVTMLCIRLNETKSLDSYDDIDKSNLVIKDITGEKDTEYFVFIYSSKNNYEVLKATELEPAVMTYFTYAHNNKKKEGIKPIYGYDVDKFKSNSEFNSVNLYLNSLNASMEVKDTPILVLVSEGAVSTVYKNIGGSTGIEAALSAAMNPDGSK